MNRLLIFAAVVEAVTGLAMMMAPSLVAQLLLGAELSGVALVVARVAGIGLFSLGLACWPNKDATPSTLSAILTYNLLVVLYLSYLGTCTEWTGSLLWPAVVFHAALIVLLVRAWLAARKATDGSLLGAAGDSLRVSCIVFAIRLMGILAGVLAPQNVAAYLLSKETKDVIRLGTGLIGTIAAKVS